MEIFISMMIRGLVALLVISTRSKGDLLPKNIFNLSVNEGYRFSPPELYSNGTFGEVKHMEVYEKNQDYLLILANRSLWLCDRETSQEFYSDLVDSSYVTQTLNLLLGPLELKTFFQIDSSRIILVYSNIYCLILLQPDVDPKISVYLGDCTQSGTIDGNEGTGRFTSIVAVAGDARNRSVAFVLQQDGTIRELDLKTRTIRTIHTRDTRLQNADSMTYGYNHSLVITVELAFIEFRLQQESVRIIWGHLSAVDASENEEGLALASKTSGYAINQDLLAVANTKTSTIEFFNGETQKLYSLCDYNDEIKPMDAQPCSVIAPQVYLYEREILYVGGLSAIHTVSVVPVIYCGLLLGWKAEREFPLSLEYSGTTPLIPGVYSYEMRSDTSVCEKMIELQKSTVSMSPTDCKRAINVNLQAGENSRSVQVFKGVFIQLSAGLFYFLENTSGDCLVNVSMSLHSENISSTPGNITTTATIDEETTGSNSANSTTSGEYTSTILIETSRFSSRSKADYIPKVLILGSAGLTALSLLLCFIAIAKHQIDPAKRRLTIDSMTTKDSSPSTTSIDRSLSTSYAMSSLHSSASMLYQPSLTMSASLPPTVEFIKRGSILHNKIKLKRKGTVQPIKKSLKSIAEIKEDYQYQKYKETQS